MWISKITLENWSRYERSTFVFPKPENRRNVVLIGAHNGIGKSRLLEAITLCLFGAEGMHYLARPGASAMTYANFLQSAFRKNAIRPKASAKIEFDLADGSCFAVERIWHFRKDMGHREEELRIWHNDNPVSSGQETADEFKRGLIAQRLLPPPLAPFFCFDSAQVQHLARKESQGQIRLGVESILGVPLLRELKQDLDAHSRRKWQSIGPGGDEKMNAVLTEVASLEQEVNDARKKSTDMDEQIAQVEKEQSNLVIEVSNMGGADVAAVGLLQQESMQLRTERDNTHNQLEEFILNDFSLALSGDDIIEATISRLRAEIKRDEWKQKKESSSAEFAEFLDNLEKSPPDINPPLSEDQLRQLRDKLRVAWNEQRHPAPSDCAEGDDMHTLLGHDREAAIQRLEILREKNADKIMSLRSDISKLDEKIRALTTRIANATGGNPAAMEKLNARMQECQEKIRTLHSEKNKQIRRLEGAEGELHAKKAESQRLSEKIKTNKPNVRIAKLATSFANLIDRLIAESYPLHVREIAEQMTAAYLAMANKAIVSKIEIDENCAVKMLNRNERDISEIDPSHGESQIFTLSLIAAIVAVSRNRFPFIIDMPLGALDTGHRRKFLQYFSSSVENQVILLSTNEEVRNDELSLIRPQLAAKMLIADEPGADERNIIKPGHYFPEIEQ